MGIFSRTYARPFVFFLVLQLLQSATATASVDCKTLLNTPREEVLSRFRLGTAIHELSRKVHSIDAEQFHEMDLHLLAKELGKLSETSFGRGHVTWLLANPRTDVDAIREVQASVVELRDNHKLRAAVVNALASIRNYEARFTISDRVIDWTIEKVLRRRRLEGSGPPRFAWEVLAPFIEEPNSRQKLYGNVQKYGLPVAGIIGKVTRNGWVSGTAAMMNAGVQQMRRRRLLDLQLFTITFRSLSKALLENAETQHLQTLGRFLDAASSNHELNTRALMKSIDSPLLEPIAGTLDKHYLSNLPLGILSEKVRKQFHLFSSFVSAVAEVDALLGFSRLLEKEYFAMPQVLSEEQPTEVSVIDGRNPLLELLRPGQTVPNHVTLSTDTSRGSQVLFLTGLNAGGKSTYVRMIAQMVVLAQSGAPVPAQHFRVTPVQLFTALRRIDSITDGASLYRAEVKRVKKLVEAASNASRPLVLSDELFSGTTHEEKTAGETGFIRYFQAKGAVVVASSHNHELGMLEGDVPGFKNIQIGASADQPFRITSGVSSLRNAMDVMAQEGLPSDLVDEALRVYEKMRRKPR